MAICYGCLHPFAETDAEAEALGRSLGILDGILDGNDFEDLPVEEPREEVLTTVGTGSLVRFHVSVSGLFGYDIYMRRAEGAQLRVGCARDNDIVLPHTESRRHLLSLYYAREQVWVKDCGSTQQAIVEGIPLTGTRSLKPGARLQAGEVTIELVGLGEDALWHESTR
jgi:hypothetical protein